MHLCGVKRKRYNYEIQFYKQKERHYREYMGAKAYKMTPEMELYSTVVTCVVDDSYYESNTDRVCQDQKSDREMQSRVCSQTRCICSHGNELAFGTDNTGC